MAENQFQLGDIVYHKANNLRMVVQRISNENTVVCEFINRAGNIVQDSFSNHVISNHPKEDAGIDRINIQYSL